MRPTSNPSNDKKKKEKERRAVKDDFYDRINYYESRNIFSSNEPFNPSNRLYTDQAALSHPVWSTIGRSAGRSHIPDPNEDVNKEKDYSLANKELTQSLLTSINKLNTSSSATPIGCKKCGYVGHLPFQCRNDIKLKSNIKKEVASISASEINSNIVNIINNTIEREDMKSKEVKDLNDLKYSHDLKKEKKKKKHKKEKKHKKDKKKRNRSRDKSLSRSKSRSRSRSRHRSKSDKK